MLMSLGQCIHELRETDMLSGTQTSLCPYRHTQDRSVCAQPSRATFLALDEKAAITNLIQPYAKLLRSVSITLPGN